MLFDENETANGGYLRGATDDSASASGSGGKDSADEEGASSDSRLGRGTRRASRARAP